MIATPKAPKPIFLNWKGPQGRETVDSVEHDTRQAD